MIAMMALFVAHGGVGALQHVILDGSNLQLNLRPGGATLSLASLDVPRLHERHDRVIKILQQDDTAPPPTTTFFDGGAFNGDHAGAEWECDPEAPDAAPVSVSFTKVEVRADDAVVQLAQDIGSAAGSPVAELITTGHARSILEKELPMPRPVLAVTLLKSAMGKGKRDKRESFLRTVGLTKMGDTVHMPLYDEMQQERALSLMRGLHSLERGVVRIDWLAKPAAMVVSDDRGLRRRCLSLANPPLVLGRKQWENWLARIELEGLGPL